MSDKPNEEAAAAPPAKKSKMPIIVMGVGVVSLLGAGATVFLGHSSAKAEKKAPKGEHGEAAGEEEHAEEEEEEPADAHGGAKGAFNQKLDPFIANLTSEDGEMHYIKCSVIVELRGESEAPKLEKKLPRIRQDILLYLASLSMAQTEGGENKRKIREGLDATVKAAAGKALIKNTYVVELVIQ